MIEKQLEYAENEKVVQTQQESEEEDEIFYSLFVDEEIVSWSKTLLYSYLEEIHTALKKKRKGFGRKLLLYIEKNAKSHGATIIRTRGIDPSNYEAINFFMSMGYKVTPDINEPAGFLEGTKKL